MKQKMIIVPKLCGYGEQLSGLVGEAFEYDRTNGTYAVLVYDQGDSLHEIRLSKKQVNDGAVAYRKRG